MLIRPAPFPGELDRGYLGRVMRLNGVIKEKEIDSLMRTWAGVPNSDWRDVSCVELLCKISGMELTEFVARHTTLPLRRGITSYQPELRHGCESNRNMLWSTAMRLARPGAYFCEHCAVADIEFHGQSYWRTEHQTPGLFWCPKHSAPLRYVDDETAFLRSPSTFLESAEHVAEDWSFELMNNPTVQRYLDLCDALMDRCYPLDVKIVSSILNARAVQRGFQVNARGVKFPLLSDAVISQCGRNWIATVLPAVANKKEGVISSKLDGVLYLKTSASSTMAYVLACAVLFDSADEAISTLAGAIRLPQICFQHRKVQISVDELRTAYVQSRGDYTKAASLLLCSYQSATKRFRALGLPNLAEASGKSLFSAAVTFFFDKRSLTESAAAGGVSPAEMVEGLLRIAGAEFCRTLQEIARPGGRGSGVRRPRQLTPGEAKAEAGTVSFKYSPLRPGQRKANQVAAIEHQKVLQ